VAGGGALSGSPGTDRPTAPLGTAMISVTQSVLDVSAWRGVSAARAAEESARATRQDVQRRLTQRLATVLVAIVAAERAAELNRVGLRRALERAALSQRSFELGASAHLDVVRVRQARRWREKRWSPATSRCGGHARRGGWPSAPRRVWA
jgi:outer membrane protein TolC